MRKYHIHIPAESNDDLEIELAEVVKILTGLIEAVNDFDKNYTGFAARKKKHWKIKANNWIEKHKIIYDDEE